jgi:RAB protein geranylgeranyltransferase component A
MADELTDPVIEPNTFDLIIVGTGLPESLIAAASSAVGKTILHLDPNPFYGSHFSSLPLNELTSFLHSQSQPSNPHPQTSSDYDAIDLNIRPMYSDVEIVTNEEVVNQSRKFNLDLAGPRVLFCADSAVDLLLKAKATHNIEFKNVEESLVYDESGKLWNVPDSRSAIFKNASMTFREKNLLMSFFKLVQGHLEAVSSNGDDVRKISDEDLESPFALFLDKMRLTPKLKSIILYAIAMADYDQDSTNSRENILKTNDGIDRLALYHSSIGRFPNALGALIYPIYGLGELPQAFCRCAAVKGSLYILRMPVVSLLIDKSDGGYKGIKLSSGQEVFSNQIVLDPSFTISSNISQENPCVFGLRDVKGKVARAICVTNTSLKPDVSTCLVFYPPKSLYPEQVASVRVLQISSNQAACPSGMFVLYLSALCDDSHQGKKLLNEAINALFPPPVSRSSELEDTEQAKPTLLWTALYIQDLTMGESGSGTPMPDANLNYNDLLNETTELFKKIYPNEELFPVTASDKNENKDNSDEQDLESL